MSDETPAPTLSVEEMLAHMLEWHRRESLAQFIDFARLRDWAVEEADPDQGLTPDDPSLLLQDEVVEDDATASGRQLESCLLDVELVSIGDPAPGKRVKPHTFRCRPGSWRIKAGSTVEQAIVPKGEKVPAFTIDEIDPEEGIFVVSRVTMPETPGPLVLKPFMGPDTVWESVMRVAESALDDSPQPEHRLALSLLRREAPLPAQEMAPVEGEDASERARRLGARMTAGVLPIQGPPGTGKTWLGSYLIADALRRVPARGGSPVIVVTANSHRVIDNLLDAVARRCDEDGIDARIVHVGKAKDLAPDARAERIDGGAELEPWIKARRSDGNPVVVGATKFALARAEMANEADLVVMDEAGQVPLADGVAVAHVAPVMFALGDPQQLTAPIQAVHEAAIQVSVLEYLARGRAVLADDVGVFLDRSHRMHEAVCRVVADLAYEGRLRATDAASSRTVSGPDLDVAGTTIPVRPGVAWVPVGPGESDEVDAVLELIEALLRSVRVTSDDGSEGALTPTEIIVVAPHNAHVNRLQSRVPTGVRVGTVDRFQGSQAHVVVYSMGRLAERPGDVPFLYDVNRLNVALSRARLMAVVIGQSDAVFPPVSTPEQLIMASRFIRAVAGG
jgi:uncharacterized protein